MKKILKLSDIGYYGKLVEALTKQELQSALLDLSQQLHECAFTNEHCNILNWVRSCEKKR